MTDLTLKQLRIENNKSRAEVAAALSISVRAICNYECGVRRIGLEQVLALAKLYDCPAEEIITAQLNSCLCAR